jgi:hypothetical protein
VIILKHNRMHGMKFNRVTYLSLVSYLFTLFHRESQWQRIGWLSNSILIYVIPCFSHSFCLSCCLLHTAIFFDILFDHENKKLYVPPKRQSVFAGVYGVISPDNRNHDLRNCLYFSFSKQCTCLHV